MNTDTVVRKRGAYIMQLIPNREAATGNKIENSEIKKKNNKGKQSKKKGEVSG
jgi:hypothetical protein